MNFQFDAVPSIPSGISTSSEFVFGRLPNSSPAGTNDSKPVLPLKRKVDDFVSGLASVSHKEQADRVEQLVAELRDDLSAQVIDRMQYMVTQLLLDRVPLTVSRQAISGAVEIFSKWNDEPAKIQESLSSSD